MGPRTEVPSFFACSLLYEVDDENYCDKQRCYVADSEDYG